MRRLSLRLVSIIARQYSHSIGCTSGHRAPQFCTMPLCSLHLVRLRRDKHASRHKSTRSSDAASDINQARKAFLQAIVHDKALGASLVVAYVVRRPVIVANRIDHVFLNATPWDLLLVFKSSGSQGASEPLALETHAATRDAVSAEYSLAAGVPSRILDKYGSRTKELNEQAAAATRESGVASTSTGGIQSYSSLTNDALQMEPARTVAHYAPKTSQNLEMSPDLLELIGDLEGLESSGGDGLVDARGPVQQLNLLAFKKGKEDKERYYKYGQGFGQVAPKFGGEPKLLGGVVLEKGEPAATQPRLRWDEVSLVHYPSLRHFAAMAASEAYQDINRTLRLPSLNDTTIVCTQEVDLDAFRKRYALPAGQGAKL